MAEVSELSGAAVDVLLKLYRHGPQSSGDVPSKVGLSELIEHDLAESHGDAVFFITAIGVQCAEIFEKRIGEREVKPAKSGLTLDAPARVGVAMFSVGVAWETVIAAAQRLQLAYEEEHTHGERQNHFFAFAEVVKSTALMDVAKERLRQQGAEGWTSQHDDTHVNDEIAALAAFYAMPPAARDWPAKDSGYGETFGEAVLPVGWAAKPGDRRRELVKAGALILAEIERLDRTLGGNDD